MHSRQNPSARYRELLAQYQDLLANGDVRHGKPAAKTFDGRSLPGQAERICKLVSLTRAKTVLDYGSGKGTQYEPNEIYESGVLRWRSIREYWGVDSIRCYDPAYERHRALPEGRFDGVICTDVLEHCPEPDLPWIVAEMFSYARSFVFASVACYPALKSLPNGENAHCTVRDIPYWRSLFEAAAAQAPGVKWECWADVERNNRAADVRIASFEYPAPRARTPAWKMV